MKQKGSVAKFSKKSILVKKKKKRQRGQSNESF